MRYLPKRDTIIVGASTPNFQNLQELVMGKGNNSQGKEKKKPKKDAKAAPVKATSTTPKKK